MAPDLWAAGPPLAISAPPIACEAGIRSAPAAASAAKVVRIPALLLIKLLPSDVQVYWRHATTGPAACSGGRELGEEGAELAEGLTAAARPELGELAPRLPQRIEQAAGRVGHVGVEHQGRHPKALGQAVEDRVEAVRGRVVLGQLPGLGLLDVLIEATDELPDLLEGL